MSIERFGHEQQIVCDECGEVQKRTYDAGDFDVMVSDAKLDRWRIRKGKEGWEHYCPGCSVTDFG